MDLYAGTGALGIEALSRGAAWADFVESDATRWRDIRDSVQEFGLAERSKVMRGKAVQILGTVERRYSLVFADPPYKTDPWDVVMERLQEQELLVEGALVVTEHANTYEMADRYGGLEVWKRRRYGDTVVSIFINGA